MQALSYNFSEEFQVNDLRFYIWAFDQFIGDVRDLLSDPHDLPRQYDLEELNTFLQGEFDLDAEYQRYWWLYFDRAAEALPLLESDGPEHYKYPIEGFNQYMDLEKVREYAEEDAYINLVGENVDRKLGDLAGFNPNFYAKTKDPNARAQIDALNEWVRNIKDNNKFDLHFENVKFDFVTVGSGVMSAKHGVNFNSSEMAMFKNYMERKEFLTPDEMHQFEDVFNYHQLNYIPTFNCVRFRGASGAKASSLHHPVHRQFHHFEHMTVADARNRWPDMTHEIREGLDQQALDLSPELNRLEHDMSGMTTIIHDYIVFPVRETLRIPLLNPTRGAIEYLDRDHPRYACSHITRCSQGGILDMDLDYYNHGKLPYVQFINYPSSKHSCGIGMIKFGRDPALIHNKAHNGAIRYFGRQLKGGGFYADNLIDADDIGSMSKGNRWVPVDLTKARDFTNRNSSIKLGDFIQANSPPTFPSAWANLMAMEEQAVDRSMRAGSAWKGERTGYSGLQQVTASNDASMVHAFSHKIMKNAIGELSEIVFSNVVQFDGDRYIRFTRESEDGDVRVYELNKPMFPITKYNEQTGMYDSVPSYILNHVGQMNFITTVEPENIIPDRPSSRLEFFLQLLQMAYPYSQTEEGRLMLRGFMTQGMRIPGMHDTLDSIDELQKQRMKMNGQLSQIAREYEKLKDDREYAIDKAEANQNLLRLTHKFVADLLNANPEVVNDMLGGDQQRITNQLKKTISGLLSGQINKPGMVPDQGQRTPEMQKTLQELQAVTNNNQNQ
jgi:hypothetical protein